MTRKEYLSEIGKLKRRLKYLRDIDIYMSCEQVGGIDYSKDKVQTSPSNRIEQAAWNMLQQQNEINRKISKCLSEIEIRVNAIETVTPLLYSKILYMIYYDELSISEVADSLGYSYNYVSKIHKLALSKVMI